VGSLLASMQEMDRKTTFKRSILTEIAGDPQPRHPFIGGS
jgi:hypothetical protein